MLQAFYQACSAEGGTADEIHLRGIKAALATQQTALPVPSAPNEDWAAVAAFAQDMRARGLAEQAHGDELLKLANQRATPVNLADLHDPDFSARLSTSERLAIAWGLAPSSAQPAAIAQPAEGPSPVALGRSGLAPDEIEASFRDWWKDRYGSACFGAVPLVAVIEWTQFALPRSYRPTFQPIPVSERLPGPDDCTPWPDTTTISWCWAATDHDGEWGWNQYSIGPSDFNDNLGRIMRGRGYTHWAPWWAIPLPGTTEMVGEVKP
jgi:hypothetical protein